MFGFKLKDKLATEKEEIVKTEMIVEENDGDDSLKKLDLSRAIGKSREKMEKDFYVFQIKELMSKVGLFMSLPVESVSEAEKEIISAKKYSVENVLLCPLVYYRLVEKSSVLKNIFSSVLVDYPYGQEHFKTRIQSVKTLNKTSPENIVLTYPISIDDAFLNKVNKRYCAKAISKSNEAGVLIGSEFGEEIIKKNFCALSDLKMKSFTLYAGSLSGDDLISAVKCAMKNKGDKRLFVISNVDTAEDLSALTALGVDTVFTPNANKIGEELTEKFSVNLL